MNQQEKANRIEEGLPTVEAVIDEYRAQGREPTRQEAEKIREQLRADLTGFDLGSVRTLEEFQEYAGICFKTRELAPRAQSGA